MSSSPLQFLNARTQPHPLIAGLFVRLPLVEAPDRSLPWPATPSDPRHLVGKCNRNNLERSPGEKLCEPRILLRLQARLLQHRAGSDHQNASQVTIALFRDRKNVIRSLTAIAVVLLVGWSFFYFSDDTRGFKPVDTSVAMAQINDDNVKSAQIDDREQQLRLELKSGNADTQNSDKIITKYPTGYAVPCSTRCRPRRPRSTPW